MSGKKKKIISVVIISLILIVMVMIILITKGNKKDKTINIGKSIDVDDQSSWRADSHVVAVAESGYYFLDWDYTEDSIRQYLYVQKQNACIIQQNVMQNWRKIICHHSFITIKGICMLLELIVEWLSL